MDDPLALLIVSGSGAGKSALQDTALALCPEEDLVKVTSLTERALFYKDELSLKHKVLAMEELAGAEDAAYAIRNLISSKVLIIESTIKDPLTGRLTTMENRVYGPTSVFQTTTRPDVDPETRSRFLVTTIDESREQTKRILEAQRKARTLEGFKRKIHRQDILRKHHAFQRILKPLPVFNPFSELLTFTDERLLTRRDQPKYLALMETIAFLRQLQKPVKQATEDNQAYDYIEVSLSDIALANELALEILGRSLDELSGPSRRLLLLIEGLVSKLAKERKTESVETLFTRRELREFTRWSDYQIHHYLNQLVALEYLVPVCGRNGAQYQYRLVWDGQGKEGERFVLGLKTVEQLQQGGEPFGVFRPPFGVNGRPFGCAFGHLLDGETCSEVIEAQIETAKPFGEPRRRLIRARVQTVPPDLGAGSGHSRLLRLSPDAQTRQEHDQRLRGSAQTVLCLSSQERHSRPSRDHPRQRPGVSGGTHAANLDGSLRPQDSKRHAAALRVP